jgi:protein TonB
MELTLETIGFTQNDRTGLTLFGSTLVHLFVILGIGFVMVSERPRPADQPEFEITLVNAHSEDEPEDAEVLAQANQAGGGDESERMRAAAPLVPVKPATELVIRSYTPPAEPEQRAPPAADTILASQDGNVALVSSSAPSRSSVADPDEADERQVPPVPPLQSQLTAEIDRFWRESQALPKHKFISSRTREDRFAAYMEAWRAHVERVGNLNYPEVARENRLSGDLVLDVAINADGTVNTVRIARSSGQTILDDAAIRIVQIAAPYPPFPDEIRHEVDVLHITRTWQFLTNNQLISR